MKKEAEWRKQRTELQRENEKDRERLTENSYMWQLSHFNSLGLPEEKF